MTDTKIKLSIPEILMHLGLLTVVFWLFACSLSFFIETENPQNLLILSTEVTLTFYFIPLKHTLKPNKFLFAFTVLFSTLNIFVVFISLFLAIHNITPYPHSPYEECLFNSIPLLLCLPLFTYLSGFIDKKHFYTLAAIIFTSSILAFALFLSLDFDSETYEYAALQNLNPHPGI
uniref:hypothetical protein n=1 Tax=Candidatus Scatocola faecipullorum TaxID=2840917 RepID=UPI004026B447